MAGPAAKMVGVGEESSSDEDEEALRRCQEAVWETRTEPRTDGASDLQQSKRVVVAAHEHDGNELQVTQGFQTHVAKKLGNLLDSCITEMQTSSRVESANRDDDDDDDGGFRLFSTSVPGQTADEPPAPVRRRPAPSSSDSDSEMEMRLKEAAVSIKDLLPSSTFSEELHCSENTKKKKKKKKEAEESHVVPKNKKDVEEEESNVKKKKKKKKKRKENGDDCAASPQRNGEQEVKRKKKKKREGSAEEKTVN